MSYEGFQQVLCKNGHYHEFDVYDCLIFEIPKDDDFDWGEVFVCHCGASAAWWNQVDQTNVCDRECGLSKEEMDSCGGVGCRFITLEKVIKEPHCKTCMCDQGPSRQYKIPTVGGHLVNQDAE